LSLNGAEACKDGRSPNQAGSITPGSQFITGPCTADADCASGCCVGVCRSFLSLSSAETCQDGRNPAQTGDQGFVAPGSQFITGACTADADCASTCCEENQNVCRAVGSLSAAESCKDGRTANQQGLRAPGTQEIAGSCVADSDCASDCCEQNANICKAYLTISASEACKDGRAPGKWAYVPPGQSNIAEACVLDSDCASTCCESNQNVCKAFLALSVGESCKNGRAPAPQSFVTPGSQFITGACTADGDCASTCCEQNQNVCRALLSLSGAEACKDGRTANQPGLIAPGTQFITGACVADSDCASACCEQNQNVCRAFLSLNGAEACKDGRSPNQAGSITPGSQFITGPCTADADCASGCCVGVCRSFLSLSSAETCQDGRNPAQTGDQGFVAPGSQFITGACTADADCASTCCEENQNVCRAVGSLSAAESCKDGRTANQQGLRAPGTQFITGACGADSDCASACCEVNQNVCRAFLSLNVQESCKDGRTPFFSVQTVNGAADEELVSGAPMLRCGIWVSALSCLAGLLVCSAGGVRVAYF